ncbi:CAP domain-containing protein [Microbacterium sp. BWT-B31]|uniref:CAP domain-containing protein n=1 Tax=Microbacterium sp. BWT-B31 TaxID=3232072 RepID=UPI0035285D1A
MSPRTAGIAGTAGAAALMAVLAFTSPAVAVERTTPLAATFATQTASPASALLVSLTNELRATLGLDAYTHSAAIDRVAQAWADKMAAGEPFAHNPDHPSQVPRGWSLVGENVAYRWDSDVAALQRQWVDSPGHYANLTGDFTHMGAAVAISEDGSMFGVQVFGRYSTDDGLEVYSPDAAGSGPAASAPTMPVEPGAESAPGVAPSAAAPAPGVPGDAADPAQHGGAPQAPTPSPPADASKSTAATPAAPDRPDTSRKNLEPVDETSVEAEDALARGQSPLAVTAIVGGGILAGCALTIGVAAGVSPSVRGRLRGLFSPRG